MLKGKQIDLRWVQEKELEKLHSLHTDISNRGFYFPLQVTPWPLFRKQYSETGFWNDDYGRLLIVNKSDEWLGSIWYFKSIFYFNALEIGYIIWDEQHRGKGIMPEALTLFAKYLFELKTIHRLELRILPENAASLQVAKKCGFKFEGIAREAIFLRGRHLDLHQYSLLRTEN